MRGRGVGTDDDDRLLGVTRGGLERVGERGDGREREHRLVDDVEPQGIDAYVDLLRRLLRVLGLGLGERDLQLGDALVRRRHHEKDQDDEQDVDQRYEIDLRLVAVPDAAQVHLRSPWAKSTSLIACCSISTTRLSIVARKWR